MGELLVLEQKHLYGETSSGVLAHMRPITLLQKVSVEQAKALVENAK